MRSRLFWKILFGVWIMLLTILLGVALSYYLVFLQERAANLDRYDRNNERFVSQMAVALQTGGRSGLDAFFKVWKLEAGDKLSVRRLVQAQVSPADRIPHHAKAGIAGTSPVFQAWEVVVSAPDGIWQLTYTPHSWAAAYDFGYFVLARAQELLIELVVSLAFSASLAWYLTRPIEKLRSGFERLASGDLRARLYAQAWRRRDEISDLARDFDRVAARLEQLVAARDQLLHDVSHELRTPLARLRLSIDLAKQSEAASAGGQPLIAETTVGRALARIDTECQRIDTLVGELLTLSRAESEVTGQDEYFDVPDLVHAIIEEAELEASHAGVLMKMCSPNKDGVGGRWSVGDAELLRRGVENVLRNALRHSPTGASVEIVVRLRRGAGGGSKAEGEAYEIEISDRGPGVAEGALETIFEPFVRLPGGRSEGFGLGLAIARRAVEANGGSVRASNRLGGGLTVCICVPAPATLPDTARVSATPS